MKKNTPSCSIKLGNGVVYKRELAAVNTELGTIINMLSLVLVVGIRPKSVVHAHVDGVMMCNSVLFPEALAIFINLNDSGNAVQ